VLAERACELLQQSGIHTGLVQLLLTGQRADHVAGFEELIRIRIALTISQSVREIERSVLESWLGLQGETFDKFVNGVCGWEIEGTVIKVPLNKENEAKGTIVRENVKMEQFSRVIRRAYEQPA